MRRSSVLGLFKQRFVPSRIANATLLACNLPGKTVSALEEAGVVLVMFWGRLRGEGHGV
jgi:hypothetical protein